MIDMTRQTSAGVILLSIFVGIALCVLTWNIYSPKVYARLLYEEVNPGQCFRMELWRAFYFTGPDYGFVKLHDNRTGLFLAESDVELLREKRKVFWWPEADLCHRAGRDGQLEIPDNLRPNHPDTKKKAPRRAWPYWWPWS
ncbi:hypothetical protein ACO2Q9_11840 [Variovorax sp. VNK109]